MDRVIKNEQKPYNETNLIRIESKSRKDICSEYLHYIENGYRLTIDDAATYLNCTGPYVINTIVPEVKHIRITRLSKMILMKYAKDNGIEEKRARLFTKRILFSEDNFKEHIRNSIELVISYKKFSENDFEPGFIDEIKKRIARGNEKGKKLTLQSHMTRITDILKKKYFTDENGVVRFENQQENLHINSFPVKLYTQKEIMNEYGIKYKVDFYRQVELKLGFRRLKYGNLVRFEKVKEDKKYIFQMYLSIYRMLQELYGEDLINIIQNEALIKLDKYK